MFFHLILALQFTAVRQQILPILSMVRGGSDVTLPCHVRNKHSCASITWLFTQSPKSSAQQLFPPEPTGAKARSKSDRLSVTKNCSLEIKTVTVEDAGRYICKKHQQEKRLDLSVLTVTEHEADEEVTLNCSLSTFGQCRHKVKWLYKGKEVDDDNKDLKTTQSNCSAGVTFKTSHFVHTSKKYDLLKCDMTNIYTKEVKQLNFSLESSSEKPEGGTEAAPGNYNTTTPGAPWWWYVLAAVGLAAILITAVTLITRKRKKENKTQASENKADPEDGVSYTYIRFTKKTNSKGGIRGGDEAVTYSSLKTPSSSAAASVDPSTLYASIN